MDAAAKGSVGNRKRRPVGPAKERGRGMARKRRRNHRGPSAGVDSWMKTCDFVVIRWIPCCWRASVISWSLPVLARRKWGAPRYSQRCCHPSFTRTARPPAIHHQVPLGIHSAETFLEGGPSYSGVDLCVTMDRLVLLDAPALFESLPAHPLGDPKSELYLTIFLASICHCILVVTDTAVDPELWSFLRLLATLKSKVPDLGSWLRSKQAFDGEDTNANANTKETVQSLPRLLVVFNNVEETEETEELEDFLKHSEWKAAPWIRCARAPHLPGQSAREMLCSKEAATLGKSLRQQLAEGVPGGFGGLPLTEKQWLHHVLDYWEFIHKRSDVQSYFDLLSSGRLKSFDSPDPKSS
ncbi:unnamed protein product [Cladocopium goreaui]|uniref:Nonsense-mediated mRNA decay factor SMG9 n=1 Tax=Cladocopium goreaui TaxID=2562237 RepID=A0A9P1BI11_9DINO|nr:unnamed protein product [Cladocopium goreaui]